MTHDHAAQMITKYLGNELLNDPFVIVLVRYDSITKLCSGPGEGRAAIQDWLFVLAPFGQTFIRSESKIILCNDLKDAQPCNLKVMKIVFANKIFFAEV